VSLERLVHEVSPAPREQRFEFCTNHTKSAIVSILVPRSQAHLASQPPTLAPHSPAPRQ